MLPVCTLLLLLLTTRQVANLHPSDFFGEVALIEKSMRTASVIAKTAVVCMSLTRRHFEKHLGSIKVSHSYTKHFISMHVCLYKHACVTLARDCYSSVDSTNSGTV
jgi:CRP-like cAMP-binding protein